MELLYADKRERRRHVAGVAGRSPARRVLVKVESDVWSSDGKIVIRRTTCMDTRDGKVGYYMRKMERWDTICERWKGGICARGVTLLWR